MPPHDARCRLRLAFEPVFCGSTAVSVGTISHVRLLRDELSVGLAEAKQLVDRCVFDGETVDIAVESPEHAHRIAQRLRALEGPTVRVHVIVNGQVAEF